MLFAHNWLSKGINFRSLNGYTETEDGAIVGKKFQRSLLYDNCRSAELSAFQAYINKKAQLTLTNPRDACERFARFT